MFLYYSRTFTPGVGGGGGDRISREGNDQMKVKTKQKHWKLNVWCLICLFIIPPEVIVYATHQVVILTTLWTLKNIFCFNNNISIYTDMQNDNSKQNNSGKEHCGRYHGSSDCFENPKKVPTLIKPPKCMGLCGNLTL